MVPLISVSASGEKSWKDNSKSGTKAAHRASGVATRSRMRVDAHRGPP